MSRRRDLLAGTLALLFLGLSFNAYACLVPLPGVSDAPMARDCSTPGEQPARQFCDAFKTLGVQPAPEHDPLVQSLAPCPEGTASLTLLLSLSAPGNGLSLHHPAESPPVSLLPSTTVLRL